MTKRARDLILEIGVAIALVLGLIIWAFSVSPETPFPAKWVSFAATTAVTFWYPVREYRHYWHHVSFWVKVSALLLVHIVAYTFVLLHVAQWPLLWFVPPSIVEGMLLVLILDKLVDHPSAGWR